MLVNVVSGGRWLIKSPIYNLPTGYPWRQTTTVGWVRRLIREDAQRGLLFDLDRIAQLFREGDDREGGLDLILKNRSNLQRRWLED